MSPVESQELDIGPELAYVSDLPDADRLTYFYSVERMVASIRSDIASHMLLPDTGGTCVAQSSSIKVNIMHALESGYEIPREQLLELAEIFIVECYTRAESEGLDDVAIDRLDLAFSLLHLDMEDEVEAEDSLSWNEMREQDFRLCAGMIPTTGDPRAVELFRQYLSPEEFKELALKTAYFIVNDEAQAFISVDDDKFEFESKEQAEDLLKRAAICVKHAIGEVDIGLLREIVNRMSCEIPTNHGINIALQKGDIEYFREKGIPIGDREPFEQYREVIDAITRSDEADGLLDDEQGAFEKRFL